MWAFTTSMLHYDKRWEESSDDKGGAGGYGKMMEVGQFMRTTHMQYKNQVPLWLDEAFWLALRVLAVFLVIGAMRWGHQEQEDSKTGEDSGRARDANDTSQCIALKDDPFQIKERNSGLTRSLPPNPGPAGGMPLSPSLSPPPPSPPRPPLSPPSPSPTQSSLHLPPQKSLRLPAKVLAAFLFAFGFALGGGLLCLDVGSREMTITQFSSSSSSSSSPSSSSFSSFSSPSVLSLRSSSFTFSSLSSSFFLSSSFLSSFSHSSKDEQTDALCPPLTIATSLMNLERKEERQSSNVSWFAHVYHRWQGPQGGRGSPSFPPLPSTSSLTSSAQAFFIRSWRGSGEGGGEGGKEGGKEGGREEERGERQNTLPPLLPKEGAVSLIDDGERRVGLGSKTPPGREMERRQMGRGEEEEDTSWEGMKGALKGEEARRAAEGEGEEEVGRGRGWRGEGRQEEGVEGGGGKEGGTAGEGEEGEEEEGEKGWRERIHRNVGGSCDSAIDGGLRGLEGDIVQKEGGRAGEKEGEETQERLGKEREKDVGKEKGEEAEVEEKSRNQSDGLREAERKEEEAQEEAVEWTLSFNQLDEQQLETPLPPLPPASFPPPFPSSGEYPGWSATHTAAEKGDVSSLRSLLQSLPPSLLPSLVTGPGPGGVRPLMLSVRTGHVGVVKMLLQLGKEACRARDEVGRHALLEAWERRDVEMIRVLISCFQEERGGKSWGKDEEDEGREEREGDRRGEKTLPAPSLNDLHWRSGQGLIHDAVREGWREVLKELIAMGRKGSKNIVDINLRSGGMGVTGWGWTPMQMAAMKDDKEGGRLLWREEAVREKHRCDLMVRSWVWWRKIGGEEERKKTR